MKSYTAKIKTGLKSAPPIKTLSDKEIDSLPDEVKASIGGGMYSGVAKVIFDVLSAAKGAVSMDYIIAHAYFDHKLVKKKNAWYASVMRFVAEDKIICFQIKNQRAFCLPEYFK